MTECKPCPFCGGSNLSISVHDVQPDDYHGGFVTCTDCDAQGADGISINGWLSNPDDARVAAIAAWNRRPLESVNADLLDALRVAERIIKVNAPQCTSAIKVVEDAISLAEKSNG